MGITYNRLSSNSAARGKTDPHESGFTLVEFLVSSFILLIISAAVFSMLSEIQRTASYQSEVQAVLNNSRIAMQTVERCIRQAGNDPLNSGLAGITIVSPTEVRLQADLTGSANPTYPDKGDPDGDIGDSGEDITIRYHSNNQTLELLHGGRFAQPVANYISAFSMQYFDSVGNTTMVGSAVHKVAVSITASSKLPNPQTHQAFGLQLNSDVQLSTRQ